MINLSEFNNIILQLRDNIEKKNKLNFNNKINNKINTKIHYLLDNYKVTNSLIINISFDELF